MSKKQLDRLASWKGKVGSANPAELERLLSALPKLRVTDPASLASLHETLLFLRAYPANERVADLADKSLFSLSDRLKGIDLAAFEEPEVSGVAGTSFSAVFSYETARRLVRLFPNDVRMDWDRYVHPELLGPVLSRFLPMLHEDWPVEAHTPFQEWMKGRDLGWLLQRIGNLPLPPQEQAAIYNSMQLPLHWEMGNCPLTRTRLRLPGRKLFFQDAPLLRRSEVSLESELSCGPLLVSKLSKAEAGKILDTIVTNSAMRYRELYGFMHPDQREVFHADLGRGVEIYFFGIPPEFRLPLRAYHCGMFFKNGVPAGYVETLTLFDRAEIGFNLYYTFREGETAWIFARMLHLFRQTLGVNCFSVDPYQIGLENEEAIESGAFWFYRKLGFRPVGADVLRLTEREERKMHAMPGYRTPAHTLRKLAVGHVVYGSHEWDGFSVQRLALKAHRRNPLRLIPGSARWTAEEKAALDAILREKDAGSEVKYLRLMQCHRKLRIALQKLGS